MGCYEMILMDSCAIIWDALDSDKLTKVALQAIDKADENNQLFVCDISLWEISMLISKNRLEVDDSPANFLNLFLQSRAVQVLAIETDEKLLGIAKTNVSHACPTLYSDVEGVDTSVTFSQGNFENISDIR